MSVYKTGKNRQIDTTLPQKLKSIIRWIIQNEYRIRLGIFHYVPDIFRCRAKGHDKDSPPLGKAYRTPWDTRKILTGQRGELLGIIEEYELMDNGEWDDPYCPYSYGVNKRIPIFV